MRKSGAKFNSGKVQSRLGLCLLFIALSMALIVESALAGKGGNKPPKGGGGTFSAKFCLDMNDDSGYSFESDGNGPYCDSKDEKVSVTAGETGFNFQSYSRNRGTAVRDVQVNFPVGGVTAVHDFNGDATVFVAGAYTMTMRFDQDDDGLDWGSIGVGESGVVSISIWLQNAAGDDIGIAHGTVADPLTSGQLAGNECVLQTEDAVITNVDGIEWSIESFPGNSTVCLWDRDMGFENQTGVPISMPYKFSLFVQ